MQEGEVTVSDNSTKDSKKTDETEDVPMSKVMYKSYYIIVKSTKVRAVTNRSRASKVAQKQSVNFS